jgi:Lon protease-like protein
MAMFPLGTVLLPGAALPLQVFEPRYVQMIRDILADDANPPAFGVTMIERGHEVGGGDERAAIGTVARISRIEASGSDRYQLVAIGTERLRVDAWLPDDPYPRAEVTIWPDEGAEPANAMQRIAELHIRIQTLIREVSEFAGAPAPDVQPVDRDPHIASFQLSLLSPVGPADRYRLLCAPSLEDRLNALDLVLDDVVAVLKFRRS